MAITMLIGCCAVWGLSFPLMQIIADGLGRASGLPTPLSFHDDVAQRALFTGWRFLAATVLYGLCIAGRLRRIGRQELLGGLAVGSVTSLGLVLQMTGLRYALPSLSSVLTALSVIVAPVAQSLLLRQPVRPMVWATAAIAFTGVVVLGSGNAGASAERTLAVAAPLPWLGEMLTLVGMLMFTVQILALDRWGKRGSDPELLAFVMFATCGTLSLGIGCALGDGGLWSTSALAALRADHEWLAASATVIVLCTALAMWLMIRYQPVISPAAACVLYCLEPVFATLASVAMRTERLTTITVIGGGLIIAAVLGLAIRRGPGAGGRGPAGDASPTPEP